MSGNQEFLSDLSDFDKTAESIGFDLRNDLAEIILQHLDGKNWTQAKLAAAMGVKPPFITRLIHSSANCTFDVAGRALFALGVRGKLIAARERSASTFNPVGFISSEKGKTNAEKAIQNTALTTIGESESPYATIQYSHTG